MPPQYWDGQGKATFLDNYGNLDRAFEAMWLEEKSEVSPRYSPVFGVEKEVKTVYDRPNHTLLGEITIFRFWGGWTRRNLTPTNTADSCHFIDDLNAIRAFYRKMFRQADSSR